MEFIEGLLYVIWRGLAIGVIISAPMGPVGILCVQRTLEKGRRTGFFTGIGAAVSDLFYCLVTGFGLSFIEDFLNENQDWIQIVGSVVLLVFGFYLFRSNPSKSLRKPGGSEVSSKKHILHGFLFTVSNPLIIFLIIGLFARFNFMLPDLSWIQYIAGYASIIAGALGWWWVVSFFIDKVRNHFNLRSMWLINRITGCIIMIFGVVGLITATAGLVSAAGRPEVNFSLNSRREPERMPMAMANGGTDTLMYELPLAAAGDFVLSFRLDNAVASPWAIVPHGEEASFGIWIVPVSRGFDSEMADETGTAWDLAGESTFSPHPCGVSASGCNSFRLSSANGVTVLEGGNSKYTVLGRWNRGWPSDSIMIAVPPGGKVSIDWIEAECKGRPEERSAPPYSHFTDEDVRRSYLLRSRDLIEGEWLLFDYNFTDQKMQPGGDYRLFAIRSDGNHKGEGNLHSYDLVYLDGARKQKDEWRAGRIKARLVATPFRGVYNVEWFGPEGLALPGLNKAQVEGDVMTLQFPSHASTVRLRRVPISTSP